MISRYAWVSLKQISRGVIVDLCPTTFLIFSYVGRLTEFGCCRHAGLAHRISAAHNALSVGQLPDLSRNHLSFPVSCRLHPTTGQHLVDGPLDR